MSCLRTGFAAGTRLNGRYQTYSPLNHGSFGMVLLAKDTFTGNFVAVKCLTKATATADNDSGFKVDDRSEELQIHSRIRAHPYIVNLLDAFESDTHSFIVLEYCSMGDLYEAIRQDKGPKQTEHVRAFMLQLVDALSFLHSCGIYHRDIKPENIFLTENGNMKLGDFGLATTDTWSYETAVGSDRYMAPEQFDHLGFGLCPAQADIWSLGICLLNILFSRNPFAVPNLSDPLYQDFASDRQTLFDVFPNMSQDTFQVLVHCLAIDPAKRDLSLVREALQGVISFTTDDESIDEFCNEDRENVTATAGRQPLRTPSITSPTLTNGEGAFPWAKALHMTSPRKLSVIPDTISEDLFTSSDDASSPDWADKTDTRSFDSSAVDSGLGVSIESSLHISETRAKPVTIVGSLPARASSAFASLFGKKKQFESKSWSDLYEEDEEEGATLEWAPVEKDRKPASKRPSILSRHSKVSALSQEDDSEDGRSTPRARQVQTSQAIPIPKENSSVESLSSDKDLNVSEYTGFMFEDDDLTTVPRTTKSPQPIRRGLIDKWAALGEKRRRGTDFMPTAVSKPVDIFGSSPQVPESLRSRLKATNLRNKLGRQTNTQLDHSVWQQKEWNMSSDWRRSTQDLPRSPLSAQPRGLLNDDVQFSFQALRT